MHLSWRRPSPQARVTRFPATQVRAKLADGSAATTDLEYFHGVRTTMGGNPYLLGVALHDLQQPRTVRMSSIPVLFPSRADCRVGETDYVHVPNVVFSCAMLRRPDGSLLIYYGGNDTVMNLAVSHEDVLAELCRRYGQDPLTGRLRYPV